MISRKRSRPNPVPKECLPPSLSSSGGGIASPSKEGSTLSSTPSSTGPGSSESETQGMKPQPRPNPSGSASKNTLNHRTQARAHKTRSWYGSWSGKSQASTQLAFENIPGGTLRPDATPDFSRFETKKSAEASTDSDAQSVRTLPKTAEADATSTNPAGTPKQQQPTSQSSPGSGNSDPNDRKDDNPTRDDGERSELPTTVTPVAPLPPPTSSSWLGWLGFSLAPTLANTPEEHGDQLESSKETESAQKTSQPEDIQKPADEAIKPPPETPTAKQPASWFGFWSYNTPSSPNSGVQASANHEPPQPTVQKPAEDGVVKDVPPSTPSATAPESQPSAGSTWAFWSRDSGSKLDGRATAASEQGELAVIGEGSESSPRQSSVVEVSESTASAHKTPVRAAKESGIRAALSKKSKRVRPQSMDLDEPSPAPPATQSNASLKNAVVKATSPPNLLLPSFRSTYRMKENPSIIKQIAQMLLRAQQPPPNHVFLAKEPPKIRRAVAIGVHGLFPASYLRPMIGQPTGTSIRFMEHCAEAIRRWAESHGCGDIEIEKIALEGEGKIAERMDNLWKLLLNWIDHIRRADLIVLACHSQGVPVGMMLVEKLIELGIVNGARIGVCAMAGVSLGPFPEYKSGMGILMGSAAELWQFTDPESEVSKRYEHALQVVVNHGARITFVGSINDQLVPLESALMSPASHPYIYRAVFIDGRVQAPDFIAHLVGFALKLRNLGISDHGLIRELSVPLAGSLYSGDGHSRLYDDQQVYDLAVSHTLETTSVSHVPCHIRKHEGLANPNPYVLPWIMRGLLEEEFVKTELYSETAELLKQYDNWKPVTKALKDVKYRLEVVRSKL
ncbi:hypothetical protein DL764_001995 [Monosporascus ibericus]|uniref:YMC020W-like alpha/beta hydrolase domain-containing protein n=1 Tax=Monosporascus ibericus TaxID=155417 RepID=A0A4Q4TM73_9PEZI|nr:hypothetical protein DL764_001995 [Monosporascus ibericus]